MTSPAHGGVTERSGSLIVSSVILNAGTVIAGGLSVLFHLIIARGLGPFGYGAFTASLTYITLWTVVMEGGLGVALTREAAADGRRLAWAPRLGLWRIGLGLAGAAGAVASAWLLRFDPGVVELVVILAIGMLGLSAMRFAFAVFRAVGWFTWEAVFSALQKLVLVPLTVGALFLRIGPVAVAVAFTLSLVIGAIPAVGCAWRAVSPILSSIGGTTRPPAGFFFRTCAPLLAIDLLTGLYFRVDQILLLRLRGPEETGLYAAAYRVIEVLLLLVGGTMTVLFPRLAASARTAPDAFLADLGRAGRALWVGGVVCAVNGWLWGVGMFPAVFGRAYAPAQVALHVLLGAVPLAFVNYLFTQSLIATGRERFYAVGCAACAVVNLSLNMLLIPRWGAVGAAWVTVVTEGILLVICAVGLREFGQILPWAAALATGAMAGLAVAGGWWALPDRPLARGLLALAVSIATWEVAAPWPVWKLRVARGGRAG